MYTFVFIMFLAVTTTVRSAIITVTVNVDTSSDQIRFVPPKLNDEQATITTTTPTQQNARIVPEPSVDVNSHNEQASVTITYNRNDSYLEVRDVSSNWGKLVNNSTTCEAAQSLNGWKITVDNPLTFQLCQRENSASATNGQFSLRMAGVTDNDYTVKFDVPFNGKDNFQLVDLKEERENLSCGESVSDGQQPTLVKAINCYKME